MITRNFTLYLNAGHSVPLVINVNQYDQGEQWVFTLYNSDGIQYTPSTGAIVGIKSDGLGIINSGSVVDGKVVINETQQMTAAAGKAVFELLIDGGSHGTANFIVLVEPKPGDQADLSDSDLSLIQEAINSTTPANIASAVSTWMDNNITEPTQPVVDSSLTVSGAAADAKATGDELSDLKGQISQFTILPQNPVLTTGGNMTPNNRIKFDRMRVYAGYTVTLTSPDYALAIDVYNAESGGTRIQNNDWETGRITFTIEQDGWLLVNGARANRNLAFDSVNDLDGLIYVVPLAILDADNTVKYRHLESSLQTAIDSVSTMESDAEYRRLFDNNVYIPELRNGSMGNGGNENAVTTRFIIPINRDYDYVDFEFIGDTSVANQYGFSYTTFTGATDGMTSTAAFTDSSITHVQYNSNVTEITSDLHKRIYLADLGEIDHMGFYLWRLLDGTYVPLREPADQYCIRLVFGYLENTGEDEPIDESALKRKFNTLDILEKLKSARYVKRGTNSPLTLLHFSDPHYDWEACNRIVADADIYGNAVDDIICTGDMAANVGGTIASWWKPQVLTCIGNHDTATYNTSTGYNWTALTMADRDTYYIAPYESNWGITHTSGTSYYYKDYTDAKVRLIVLDTMLYTDNGTEATTQTSWLDGLLASAITGGLHVLIATHAPHPGATPVQCSFTTYGETTMPVHSDCNTPQVVIDTVAAKISAGLHFIGYITGHTHQDAIWDAEGDGKQLMYCVTCANVKQDAQWNQQDLMRSTTQDAYNLVTIDTNHNLIKLIRGGGANIDTLMRPRTAICINYSTGTIISEAQDGNGVSY